ncbi:hypothetical protein SADUNF_Sadunf19G0078400 [Salix dunnii]|uniref:Uncharacterized protein n=1 Tax=Salix dunnii TaxID=1413687 RepID=A0A835J1U7_9ROSI|nr:hypothetical protein SADUNF_Sadunf19G0078400 [Salix dunnii]
MYPINIILGEISFLRSSFNRWIHNGFGIITMIKAKQMSYFMNRNGFQIILIHCGVSAPVLVCIVMETAVLWIKSMSQYVPRWRIYDIRNSTSWNHHLLCGAGVKVTSNIQTKIFLKPFRSLALLNSLQLLKEAAKRLLMLGLQCSSPTFEGLVRKDNEDC